MKDKNKIILGIVILCVIIGTIIVFNLIFKENTKLFYINAITTCFCEIILLLNIPILSNKSLLTFKNAATSTTLNIYAIVLFLWTVIYSQFIETENDFNTLYIGMIVASIIFAFSLGMVEIGGKMMRNEEKKQESTSAYKKDFVTLLDSYFFDVQTILSPDKSMWKDDTLRLLKLVLDKIANIPSEKLDKNVDFTIEVNKYLDNIKDLFKNSIQECDDAKNIQSQTTKVIEQLNNYVTSIKSSL